MSPFTRIFCLLIAATFAVPLHAAIYRVGTGTGCTHATIQDAIAAASVIPTSHTILVSRSLSYTAQAIVVTTDQELEISGGFATCDQQAPDGFLTTISGAGGTAAPVFRINGGNGSLIRLRRLFITEGDTAGTGHGGGIFYRGNGRLELHDSQIATNIAGYGGGIYAEGLGNSAELVFGANVIVSGNTARYSGGGVYLDSMVMTMAAPGSAIRFNTAQGTSDSGFGGGLIVLASARNATALIGSNGIGTQGTIFGNTARYGGGVALVSNDGNADAVLHLYGTDPFQRTAISDNLAEVVGGGIYARPVFQVIGGIGNADMLIWNADLIGNEAPDGAAAYLESDSTFGFKVGAVLFINSRIDRGSGSIGPPTGVAPCPEGGHCGRIAGNQTRANGVPVAGAIFRLRENSTLSVHGNPTEPGTPRRGGVVIRNNSGGRLVDAERDDIPTPVVLRNTVIHDNSLSLRLARTTNGLRLHVIDSTIAHNSIGAAQVLSVNGDFRMERSLVWQPGKTVLSHSGGVREVEWSMANEVVSLGGGPSALAISGPRFIDPASGDFRLRAASPAIDSAPPIPGDDRDADGMPRDQSLPGVWRPPFPNPRTRDVGAYERQNLQPLVLNHLFDVDLNLWQPVAGVVSTWDGSQNASGGPGSGSLFVNQADIPQPRVIVRTQCVHLPGPGRYLLNGWGRSGTGTPATRDAVSLHWSLRHDGGEACDAGAPNISGEHFLTTANAWVRPLEPAEIVLSPGDWSPNSSISITLVVTDRGTTAPPTVTGWFDGISLELTGFGPEVFADGFEQP